MKRAFPCLALALVACAPDTSGSYPSLALRPIEGRGFAEPEAPAPEPVVTDPALDTRIATLRGKLQASAAAFARQVVVAERAGRDARGEPAGSDRWIEAQTALAALDTLRADTSEAAAGLGDLAIARATDLKADYPALTEAQQAAERQGAAQSARIEALQAVLAAS